MNGKARWGWAPAAALLCLGTVGCGSSHRRATATTTTTTLSGPAASAGGTTGRPSAKSQAASRTLAPGGTRPQVGKTAGRSGGSAAPTSPAPTPESSPPPGGYSLRLKAAVEAFVNCMAQHGVKLPPPNFSAGPGQILSSKGVDTATPAFQSALRSCGLDLVAILRAGGARVG